jgi:hypothetical protein
VPSGPPNASPIPIAARMRIGSGTLHRQSRTSAAAPMSAVGRSVIERRPSTTTAPLIAPITAAVTPVYECRHARVLAVSPPRRR